MDTSNSSKLRSVLSFQEDMKSLLSSGRGSDVTFKVENETLSLHRCVLGARSEYFRDMLYGSFKEKEEKVIELRDIDFNTFKLVMTYIYSGDINLYLLKNTEMTEIFRISQMYRIDQLSNEVIDHISRRIEPNNFVVAFNLCTLHNLPKLHKVCAKYINEHPLDLLKHRTFTHLSKDSLEALLDMDAFPAPEIEILYAVRQWIDECDENVDTSSISKLIRINQISLDDISNCVKNTNLFSENEIRELLQKKLSAVNTIYNPRGYYRFAENVSLSSNGAKVIEGFKTNLEHEAEITLLEGFDNPKYYSHHQITGDPSCICVQLKRAYLLNTLHLYLYDSDKCSSKYYLEVSVDKKHWKRVVDHSDYLCRSFQTIQFETCAVQYIKIVGTYSTAGAKFRVLSLGSFVRDEIAWIHRGIIVPRDNVALVSKGAIVANTNQSNILSDGYSSHRTYAQHLPDPPLFIIQLSQPFWLSSMRLLLGGPCCYTIEISTDIVNWEKVWDKSEEECDENQEIRFPYKIVTFVRISGVGEKEINIRNFQCPSTECELKHPESEEKESRNGPEETFNGSYSINRDYLLTP